MGFSRSGIANTPFLPMLEVQDLQRDIHLQHVWLFCVRAELKRLNHQGITESLQLVQEREDRSRLTDAIELNRRQLASGRATGSLADGAKLDTPLASGVLDGGGCLRDERFLRQCAWIEAVGMTEFFEPKQIILLPTRFVLLALRTSQELVKTFSGFLAAFPPLEHQEDQQVNRDANCRDAERAFISFGELGHIRILR